MPEFPETSESLIARVRDPSNRVAWDQFEQLYRPVVFRTARAKGLQHSDALDLVQQVLMSVSSAIGKIVLSSDAGVASAKSRLEAERQGLNAHEAVLVQETATHNRVKELHADSLVADEKLIEAQRKLTEAQAVLAAAKAVIQSAENDVVEKQNAGDAKRLQAQADVEYYKGLVAKAEIESTRANGEVANAQADLAKAHKELMDLETKLARQESHQIIAPFDGVVTQLTGPEQLVKKGDSICTVVPD